MPIGSSNLVECLLLHILPSHTEQQPVIVGDVLKRQS
jgi:hypothetical protein